MKKILSEIPLVIIVDRNYDCSNALDQEIIVQELNNCRSEKRRDEIIYTRSILFQELGIQELKKDPIGRPTLEKGDVSITHSGELFGICHHPTKMVGIDIEQITEKASRIKEKFRNNQEKVFDVSDKEITRLWTLKEVVYKYLSRPGVLFAEEIFIEQIEEGLYKAAYIKNEELVEELILKSHVFGNYIISYTL